jgi:hypothetical protein
MDKFKTLVDVLEDYFQHIDLLNEKRARFAQKEMETLNSEMRIYELLKKNLNIIRGHDGISED